MEAEIFYLCELWQVDPLLLRKMPYGLRRRLVVKKQELEKRRGNTGTQRQRHSR
jgi:hypothetical protein